MPCCLVCREETSSRCADCKDPFCGQKCLAEYHQIKDNRSTCRTKQLNRLVEASRDVAPHRRLLVDPSAGALQFGSFFAPDVGNIDGAAVWKTLSGHLPTVGEGTALVYANEIGICAKLQGVNVPAAYKMGLRNAGDPDPSWGITETAPVFIVIIERRDTTPATYYRVAIVPLFKNGSVWNIVCQTLFTIQPVGDVLLVIEPINHAAFQRLELMYIGRQEVDMKGSAHWEHEKLWVEEVRGACRRARKNWKKNRKKRGRRKAHKSTQAEAVISPGEEASENSEKEEDEDLCPLCTEVYGAEPLNILGCQHRFHKGCWDVCTDYHKTKQKQLLCPMCRAVVTSVK